MGSQPVDELSMKKERGRVGEGRGVFYTPASRACAHLLSQHGGSPSAVDVD